MHTLMHQIILSFRLGMDAKANDLFAKFMDELVSKLPALSHDLDVVKLNNYLNQIFLAQTQADYLYLADLIEYEIYPLLRPTVQ